MHVGTMKKTQPEIVINVGGHSQQPPKNAHKVLSNLFRAAGFEKGRVEVSLGQQIRASALSPMYNVVKITDKMTIELKVKSDNNDSRWVYYYKPVGQNETIQEVFQRLKDAELALRNGKGEEAESEAPPADKASKSALRHHVADVHDITKKRRTMRRVDDILSDETILNVLLHEMNEKVENGKISRPVLLSLFKDMKLDCDSRYLVAYLIRHGFLEVEGNVSDDQDTIYLFYSSPETPAAVPVEKPLEKELEREPAQAQSPVDALFTDDEIAAWSQLKEAAGEYQTRKQELDNLLCRINTTRTELAELEELHVRKNRELEPLKVAAQKLDQIRSIMGSGAH